MSQKLTKSCQALYLLDLWPLNFTHHNSHPLVPDYEKAHCNNMENNDDKNGGINNQTFVIKRDFQVDCLTRDNQTFVIKRLPKCEMKHVLKRFSHTDLNITQYS